MWGQGSTEVGTGPWVLPLLGAHRRPTYQHVSGTQSGRKEMEPSPGVSGAPGVQIQACPLVGESTVYLSG